MKYILPLIFLSVLLGNTATYAQYTETINSNHPGQSQGGFSVGTNVLQFEGGLAFGRERHELLDTKASAFGLNYAIRYGLYFEALELNFSGTYLGQNVTETFANGDETKFGLSGFPMNTLGLKYLIWDPWKRKKEEKPNLKSWRENHRWKWKFLIPSISAFAGANFVFSSSPYRFEEEPSISPRFAVITQSDWKDRWVLVSNIIVDKVTTEFPSYEFLLTLTHTLKNPKWAVFGEYQGIKSDFYSDIIARGGAAYLIHKDFQVEAELMTSFKNTPSRFYFTLGASYRLDWHKKDEIIRDKDADDLDNLNSEESELEKLDKELEELNREIEGLNDEDTPKAPQSNRGLESFEDPEDIEELERLKEENRSQYVEEHQQEVQEKQDKKDAKLSKKEAKRQAKSQRKLEKEQLKEQKRNDKELNKLDKQEGALEDGTGTEGTPSATDQPIEEVKPIKKPKKKKRIKRKKLSEEEKEKELEDLDRQIRELELDFESDRKKKKEKKPKKKKEKKKKEKKRTKEATEDIEEF